MLMKIKVTFSAACLSSLSIPRRIISKLLGGLDMSIPVQAYSAPLGRLLTTLTRTLALEDVSDRYQRIDSALVISHFLHECLQGGIGHGISRHFGRSRDAGDVEGPYREGAQRAGESSTGMAGRSGEDDRLQHVSRQVCSSCRVKL